MQDCATNKESRVKKTLLNARVNLIFYFMVLALSFFSRKIFIDCLGASFIGLTGTLQNLLGYLNLAELGVGAAISFNLCTVLFASLYLGLMTLWAPGGCSLLHRLPLDKFRIRR